MCTSGSWFNKIESFYWFLKGIPKSHWLFFPQYKYIAMKNTMTTSRVSCCCIGLCKDTSHLTYHCFCTIGANFNTVKKENNSLVLWKLFWFLVSQKRIFGANRGPQSSLWKPLAYCLHRIIPKKNTKTFIVVCLQKVYNWVKPNEIAVFIDEKLWILSISYGSDFRKNIQVCVCIRDCVCDESCHKYGVDLSKHKLVHSLHEMQNILEFLSWKTHT